MIQHEQFLHLKISNMPEIIFRDKKVHYSVSGNGRNVMLLHGFTENSHIWDKQKPNLEKNYRLIIPDLPGSGDSEMLENANLEDFAEVIKAIADKEMLHSKDDQFTLIGHSMGGYITLAYAKKYPETLQSFGLFHSSAFADSAEKIEARKKNIQFIKDNGTQAFIKIAVPGLFTEDSQKNHPEWIQDLILQAQQCSLEALVQYIEAMMNRPDNTAVLKTFPRAILFIIGMHDKAVPIDISLQQCHIPTISHVHFLQNSAHVGMWEEAEKSQKHLLEFLNQS